MNQNETRTLWISVGAALFAVFLLYSYTEQKSRDVLEKYGKKSRVVTAAKDINEMETIDESMLELVERPDSFREPTAVSDPEAAVGLVALAPIKKGEQILESKIMRPGPVTGLALQVAPSKRAVTLPIDEMRGVSKLINPGDRIDLVAALDVGKGASQRREVKTLMQDVTVLATGVRITNELPRLYERMGKDDYIKNLRGDTTFSTITIEATPEETQKLIYILSTSPGSLFVTLRHPSDHFRKRYPSVTIETLTEEATSNIVQQQMARVPTAAPAPPPPVEKPKKKGPFRDL
ncbi:MAG: Flp pilus assembly protein CpaB [Bdellovibrionales bacterium]